MNKPTAKQIEPDPSYPSETILCLQCLHILDEEFKFCPYCGTEIVLQEEEKENETIRRL